MAPDAIQHYLRLLTEHKDAIIFGMVEWLTPTDQSQIKDAMIHDRFNVLIDSVPRDRQERINGTFVGSELRQPVLFQNENPHALDGRWALYTNTAVPIKLFKNLVGFDEDMEGYGYEDMELGMRSQQAGHKCIYARSAYGLHVWHNKRDSAINHLENQRNLNYVLLKHGWDDYYAQDIDWSLWWHYSRLRGGHIIEACNTLYALDQTKKRALKLPDKSWLTVLGYTGDYRATHHNTLPSSIKPMGQAKLTQVDNYPPLS